MYRLLRLVCSYIAQLTILPNPQNPMLYNAFQSASTLFCGGHLHPHVIHVSWSHLTQHSKLSSLQGVAIHYNVC